MAKKTFINPFHFVPPGAAVGNVQVDQVKPVDGRFAHGVPEMSHHRYVSIAQSGSQERFSGSIDCQLTTVTPCVFGNEHRKIHMTDRKGESVETTIVETFSIDGEAAIAGTSLKGMVSSLVEMTSGSAMRVLNNRAMSMRSGMHQARSAVGMVIGEKGSRKILPLTLPTFKRESTSREWVPTYKPEMNENKVWGEWLERRRNLGLDHGMTAVYINRPATNSKCYSQNHQVFAVDGPLDSIDWDFLQHRPNPSQPADLQRGQGLLRPLKRRPLPYVVEVDPTCRGQIPGIVRALGKASPVFRRRKNKTGSRREYEDIPVFNLFIPLPMQWMDCSNPPCRIDFNKIDNTLLVEAEYACAQFDAIISNEYSSAPSDKASATSLQGQKAFRLPKKKGQKPDNDGLKQGDLVYIRPADADRIESVSISSVWREGPRWLWNNETGNPELLDSLERRPFHSQRETISLAEKMFGWVDDIGTRTSRHRSEGAQPELASEMRAYRGRVRFLDARSGVALDEKALIRATGNPRTLPNELKLYVPLKILASPKPPCPELYMKEVDSASGSWLRQTFADMNAGEGLQIQGWKVYLLDQDVIAKYSDKPDLVEPFASRDGTHNAKQKCWVRPLKAGIEFTFEVRFENLTRLELAALCYALRPDDGFVHRLGFGKPLQLGGVKVEPVSLKLIDRWQRYASDTDLLQGQPRFLDDAPNASDSKLSVKGLAEEYRQEIGDHHQIIKTVGTPVKPGKNCQGVTYPYAVDANGTLTEEKIFAWFASENRDRDGRLKRGPLPPLNNTKAIPELERELDSLPNKNSGGGKSRGGHRKQSHGRPGGGGNSNRRR